MILPLHWIKMHRKPYDPNNYDCDAVYAIGFFTLKRALLFRKDYTVLTTMETRKAKQLVEEAEAAGFCKTKLEKCKLGERPETHPKECDVMYFTEIPEDGK